MIILLALLGAIIYGIVCNVIQEIRKSPFHYPYYTHSFNVSEKKNPQMEDWIDRFLNEGGFREISRHYDYISQWKKRSIQEILTSKMFQNLRQEQYQKCLDDSHAFVFTFYRDQTCYRQVNYQKYAYTSRVEVKECAYSYQWLLHRYEALKEINHECTLSEYHCKNQRQLMTKVLRDKIKVRDNYTCQICGRYMPDGVGLHIDHIIPISKGGKSIESNLQVLCDKCNHSKSNHLFPAMHTQLLQKELIKRMIKLIKLIKWKTLLDAGAVSQEEYDTIKQKLLSSI